MRISRPERERGSARPSRERSPRPQEHSPRGSAATCRQRDGSRTDRPNPRGHCLAIPSKQRRTPPPHAAVGSAQPDDAGHMPIMWRRDGDRLRRRCRRQESALDLPRTQADRNRACTRASLGRCARAVRRRAATGRHRMSPDVTGTARQCAVKRAGRVAARVRLRIVNMPGGCVYKISAIAWP